MSDIVDRLRKASDPSAAEDIHNLLIQAADRIEYLESVAGAVSQSPVPDHVAMLYKRQRDG